MYRLITLGGLTLLSDDGPVSVAATQRSRLALLAVLAGAGTTGVSRDKLLACFWPESDTERARHALKQAVYAIRRDLGSEGAISGTAAMVLDATVVSSDLRDFDDAIARRDDAAAAALYGGPFLDGVFLRNAPAFERWAEGERARLQSAFLGACERLARAAVREGRHDEAVRWWRQAAARDPLSGRIAVELMTALAESGDVTGAIRYASVHEELVRNELECAPDAAVTDCAARLRSGTWRPAAKPVALDTDGGEVGSGDAPTAAVGIPSDRSIAQPGTSGVDARPSSARARLWPVAAGAAAALLALAVTLALRTTSADARRTLSTVMSRGPRALAPRRIVVAPFANRTGDASLDPLGALTADWLARRLLEANFEVVDARTSMEAARVVAGLPRVLRAPDDVVALAEETGAATVLGGSYYLQGDSLAISATISDAARGTVTRVIGPLRAPRASSTSLVEALATRLTGALTASTDVRAGAATTSLVSPPSIDAFERTSHAWEMYFSRPMDTAAVFAELARAAASDSTYSAPLFMRAYVLDVNARWPALAAVVRTLEARRSSLNRAELAALDLFTADLSGDLVGRLRASRELAQLSPGSADMALLTAVSACYLLRGRDALDALRATDPDRGINLLSPMYWAWRAAASHILGDQEDERFSVAQGTRRFPSAPSTAVGRARVAAMAGDRAAIATLLEEVRARSEAEAQMLTQLAARELRAHGHAAAARELFAQAASAPVPGPSAPRADQLQHAMALYEAGRLEEARRSYAALVASDATDIEALGRLGTVAIRLRDSATAARVEQQLRRWSLPYSLGAPAAWRAHLAAVGGRPADAVTLLRMAVGDGYRLMDLGTVGVHDDPDFQALRTNGAFQELVRPRTGALQLP